MKRILTVLLVVFFLSCEDKNSEQNDNTIHEFTLHGNDRVSSLLMSSEEYSEWINEDGFTDTELRLSLVNDIYNKFPDKYDFIFLILNEPEIPSSLYYYGMLIGVSNDVEGIGKYAYDYSSEYGSSGRLKAVMQLTGLEYLKYGPALHEIAHQWANFALSTHSVDAPGDDITSYPFGSHWGFTGGNTKGQLGGFKQSTLIDHGNSLYSVDEFGPFANGGNSVPYNELELYLMGMLPISSVTAFDMFTDITSLTIENATYEFSASNKTTYDPESLINLLGERSPSFEDSQKDFTTLVVVITESPLTRDEWSRVDATAEWFSKREDDGTGLYNFWEATNGFGSITIEN
jgi:hypothetical protein